MVVLFVTRSLFFCTTPQVRLFRCRPQVLLKKTDTQKNILQLDLDKIVKEILLLERDIAEKYASARLRNEGNIHFTCTAV